MGSEGRILGDIGAVEAIDTKERDMLVVFFLISIVIVPWQSVDGRAEQSAKDGGFAMHDQGAVAA